MKHLPIARARRLLTLPPSALVRLYSYQGQSAWDLAKARGYWTGSDPALEDGEMGWGPAYSWMRSRMAERVPGFTGDFPMWAWMKRPSAKAKAIKYHGMSANVRLTVVVPRSRIVFSDYMAWHFVLNRTLNCATEAEWNAHCALWPLHWAVGDEQYKAGYLASIEPSWRACLSFEPVNDPAALSWSGSTKRFIVQACVDRFYWHEIVAVRRFDPKRIV
ncbi:MAG: DUF3841 domain-containing protein [Pseudomonadota bacterium]